MITRLTSISRYGVFADWSWSEALPEFHRYNILYGWNYVGKTTLSRILRSFERKQRHPDYGGFAAIEIDDGSDDDTDRFALPLAIRVFNRDFVDENISFHTSDKADMNPILIIGEENVDLERQLSTKEKEVSETAGRIHELDRESRELRTNIDNALSDRAREIKNTLQIPD